MRKALLLYNPESGLKSAKRLMQIERAAATLRGAGVQAEMEPTKGPKMAGEQARAAVTYGFDTVIACGGDGTVHDVLQGLAGSPQIVMGVLPLGTANALANDLRIPRDPEEAARQLLSYRPKTISAGKIESQAGDYREERYFTVMSGVGPDAELIYRLSTGMKQRFGVTAYMVQAAWLYLRYHYAPFQAQYRDPKTGELRTETVAQVMAVRIDDFGGPLRRFARGAKLESDCLRLILFKRAIRVTYPMYLINALIGFEYAVPGVDLIDADEVICTALPEGSARNIYSEADGELLGGLPVRISIVPDAFTLLMQS
jgi:diacylglycerol kinase (ATP)